MRCYSAGKVVCTCLFKTMQSSAPAERRVTGFDRNLCHRTCSGGVGGEGGGYVFQPILGLVLRTDTVV